MNYSYHHRGVEHEVELQLNDGRVQAVLDGQVHELFELDRGAGELHFEVDGELQHLGWARHGRDLWLHFEGRTYHIRKSAGGRGATGGHSGSERWLRAPMPGQIREVLVEVGETVESGDVLILLEAMKMEIRIQAPRAAVVSSLSVTKEDSVEKDQVLIELDGKDD